MALGIIDWGIGGVSIYKLLHERLGEFPLVYFSDTGVTPYGKMSRTELVARLNHVIEFLKSEGVTHLAIGCNAASTAIPQLADHGIPIEGVIESAVKATARLKPRRLGVIGGRRTILSGVYRNAFRKRGIEVSQRIAQPLSGLIESGDVWSPRLREESRRILTPLRNCSHILLACTHYPAIAGVLRDHVSDETMLIDPAAPLVDRITKWNLGSGNETFLTTGDPSSMKKASKAAFGCGLKMVKRVVV